MTNYRTLEDWLGEMEVYATRAERLPPEAYEWVKTAWELGAASRPAQEPVAVKLLREARQYVFSAGNDEDPETQNHSINLVSEIDALLSLIARRRSKRAVLKAMQ